MSEPAVSSPSALADWVEIEPIVRPIDGDVRPPGSKSLTNRALITAALSDGESTLTSVLDSEDTRVMLDSLQRLGFRREFDATGDTVRIHGESGKIPASTAELWLENSGTSMRFLAAACALGEGRFRLDGVPRMRQRPIGELTSGLQQLGCRAECEANNGCPPVIVHAAGIPGGLCRLDAGVSSQFISGLLLAAPCAKSTVTMELLGDVVSAPYIDMTVQVMRAFGVEVQRPSERQLVIEPQAYRARTYAIEPDASAASYFLAAAAVTGGRVTVHGLGTGSTQGDVRFAKVLEQMGCELRCDRERITIIGRPLQGVDVDMNDISDTAQTLAAVAPFARGPTRIRNVAHMRHKETDRVAAVVAELRKLGQIVDEHDDGMTITPAPIRPDVVSTYNDHRMAMSFALIGLRTPGIRIADPGCTGKTYPRYFDDLKQLCAKTSVVKPT
jgi:3-phosphoshikimate 1-carboxyvinyltransferase